MLPLQVKQMAPLARAASRAPQTHVSPVSADSLYASAHMWVGGRRNTSGTRIQQESAEQPANGDEGSSELASVGDTPVTRLGDP